MSNITIDDKSFNICITRREINRRIKTIGSKLSKDYKDKNPLFISVLNGAFVFAAHVFQNLTIPCEVSFVKVASYDGYTSVGPVKILIGLKEEIKNRNVVIIEDIIDTGNTIKQILKQIQKLKPLDVKVVTMLFKPKSIKYKYKPDYTAFEIDNHFVVGFGLDYNGHGRNLKEIYKIIGD